MSLKALFEQLDAPLKNVRWSWGAVRERDGVVFLRVWDDEIRSEGGTRIVPVLRPIGAQRHGHRERQRQLDLVRDGATCYLVFCTAVDPDARPREIKSFDSRNVVRAGQLVQRGDELWIEVGDTVPADRVMRLQ